MLIESIDMCQFMHEIAATHGGFSLTRAEIVVYANVNRFVNTGAGRRNCGVKPHDVLKKYLIFLPTKGRKETDS
jgi:hypothetical protein